MRSLKSVLIIHPFGIGDVLFSLPLVATLREARPDAQIGYLCNRRTNQLVAIWPHVNRHFIFEKDEFRAAWGSSKIKGSRHLLDIIRTIRAERFDIAIDLSLGWQMGLASWMAGIPKRIGFDFRGRGRFLTHKLPLNGFQNKPVAEYYLDLLTLLGIEKPPQSPYELTLPASVSPQVEEFLAPHHIQAGERLIGIVPGGGASWGPSAVFKQWPPEKFAQMADTLASGEKTRVILFGDQQESSLCRKIAAQLKHPPILATQISSLVLLAGILKRCHLVIGNDSGPMHLAAAVGTKTVSIFGPVDAAVYGPVPKNPELHRVVAQSMACRPCYQQFRFPPCPWDNACLKKLPVAEVLNAAEASLRGANATKQS